MAGRENLGRSVVVVAVQASNVVLGWEQTTGRTLPGLHPV